MEEFDGLSREELVGIILEHRELVLALSKEVEELRSQLGGGGTGRVMPPWPKANRPERLGKDRKKRKKSFVRRRETPTEVVYRALETCPDCGRALSDGTVKWYRQVIEIPVMPVRVIEHRIIAGYCGVCQKRYMPRLDLSEEVVGKHRVGVRLMSLVAYLAIKGRMTKRTIQSYLEAMYGLHLGLFEITNILHTVSQVWQQGKGKAACAGARESLHKCG